MVEWVRDRVGVDRCGNPRGYGGWVGGCKNPLGVVILT